MNKKKNIIRIMKVAFDIWVDIAGLGEAFCKELEICTVGNKSKVFLFKEGPCGNVYYYKLVLEVPAGNVELDSEGLSVRTTYENDGGTECEIIEVKTADTKEAEQ